MTIWDEITTSFHFGEPAEAKIFGFDTPNPEDSAFPTFSTNSSNIAVDPDYVFVKLNMIIIQRWLLGRFNNLLITGPTGSGKTKMIEQVAARLGWPLFDVACNSSETVESLVSSVGLRNGSTVIEEGPALQTMRQGGILLLDEVNAILPEQSIGLHKILDNRGFMGRDGKRIEPHPCFRVVAIGNSIDGQNASSYSGINRHLNIAFKNRFSACLEMEYLSKEEEIKILAKKFPKLHNAAILFLVDFACGTRNTHKAGQLSEPISTRKLIEIAGALDDFGVFEKDFIMNILNIYYINALDFRQKETVRKSVNQLMNALM